MFPLILVPSSNWPSHSWLNCICLGWQLCFSGFPQFSGINGIVWIGWLITYWPDWPSNCESVCYISGGTAHIAHYWMIHASISSVQVKAVMYTACSGLWCYLECIKRSHRRVNQSCLETIIFSPSPCCPSPLLFSSSVLSPPSRCFPLSLSGTVFSFRPNIPFSLPNKSFSSQLPLLYHSLHVFYLLLACLRLSCSLSLSLLVSQTLSPLCSGKGSAAGYWGIWFCETHLISWIYYSLEDTDIVHKYNVLLYLLPFCHIIHKCNENKKCRLSCKSN